MDQFVTFLMQHWMLAGLFIVLLIALIVVETQGKVRGVAQVTPSKLVDILNHQGGVLIDIREAKLFNEGHIAGAMNIPAKDLMNSLKKLQKYKTKPVVVCCPAGHSSVQQAIKLRSEGFSNVYSLAGGLSAWQSANMPLVKG